MEEDMSQLLHEYNEFILKHPKVRRLDPINLPDGLFISTMTLTCKIPVCFDVILIAKYFKLTKYLVHTISCGNNKEIYRTLSPIKPKKKKIKNSHKRNFYNQVTLIINCVNIAKINIKLFKNGSIQITGCKNISSVLWILEKLFQQLQESVEVSEKDYDNSEIGELPHDSNSQTQNLLYAIPHIFLNIYDISDLKIAMINSNFNIGFNIDREKLFHLLTTMHYECEYDPSRHAGVKIRYKNISQTAEHLHQSSIFVFDRGSIIITGAQNYMQIMECYKFINIYLIENYSKIIRIPIA